MTKSGNGGENPHLADGDNVLLGIALMLAFCLVIPFADALTKMLAGAVPVMTLVMVRYAIQVILTAPAMLLFKRGIAHVLDMSIRTWWLLFWRTVMHVFGVIGMYFGLKHMPLADTIAIAFIFPLLMLVVGYLFLGEQVGPHRLIAALVGFAGTLMVVQPNFVAVGLNVLWPLAVAVAMVIFNLVTRQMSRSIDPVSMQAVSGIMALVALAIPIIALNGERYEFFDLAFPGEEHWSLLIAVGVIGTLGHLLIAASLRFAPSATLAPMQYIEIPFATLMGWLIFSDLPNRLAATGIAVTICAGLYIVFREQRIQRAR